MSAERMKVENGFQPRHVQCRANARLCALLAEDAATSLDRLMLLVMQQSWLALAESEEWLSGGGQPAEVAEVAEKPAKMPVHSAL